MRSLSFAAAAVLLAAACSSSSATPDPGAAAPPPPTGDDGSNPPSPSDAGADAPVDAPGDAPSLGTCVGTFGNALGVGFGRLDGTLVAIVRPVDKTCPEPNSDHIILEVQSMGAVYRVVANVHSDVVQADQRVQHLAITHALPAPAFADGQHLGITLDYVTDLGVHAGDFTPLDQDPLVATVVSELRVGEPISVYATVGAGHTDSAHLIHRAATTAQGTDGAIVVGANGASPRFILFHFSEQTF